MRTALFALLIFIVFVACKKEEPPICETDTFGFLTVENQCPETVTVFIKGRPVFGLDTGETRQAYVDTGSVAVIAYSPNILEIKTVNLSACQEDRVTFGI